MNNPKSPQDWWQQGMEDAAKIAREHKGSAQRSSRRKTLRYPSEGVLASIRDEERGEDIAADIISQKILMASKGKAPNNL